MLTLKRKVGRSTHRAFPLSAWERAHQAAKKGGENFNENASHEQRWLRGWPGWGQNKGLGGHGHRVEQRQAKELLSSVDIEWQTPVPRCGANCVKCEFPKPTPVASQFFFVKIFVRFIHFYLKGRFTERSRNGEIERYLPPTGSLHKWPPWLELGWSEAWSQELVGFPCGYSDPRNWAILCWP